LSDDIVVAADEYMNHDIAIEYQSPPVARLKVSASLNVHLSVNAFVQRNSLNNVSSANFRLRTTGRTEMICTWCTKRPSMPFKEKIYQRAMAIGMILQGLLIDFGARSLEFKKVKNQRMGQ